MDTYSQALYNYHNGLKPDTFEIIRDDGYSSEVPVSIFFDNKNFSEVELLALNNCQEKVLDIGAGVGRHSSELQRRGLDVTAIDISEQAVSIMNQRGVHKTLHMDIIELSGEKYDTLLMLMNGIGMVENPEKIDNFLQHAYNLLHTEGVLIVDSINVLKTNDPLHVSYREKNILNSRYPGQQILRIDYNGLHGDWFSWLHLTFEELSMHALKNNFLCDLLTMDESGHYLAKLQVEKSYSNTE
ncbi:MAG: class I SAM-dependent methyltransferase [Bacteroidota bacterium]